jgi:2-polyprenyl-6-hydroxyphenyl methylase/3-demethylubiquinone-9 3-methyltransferase
MAALGASVHGIDIVERNIKVATQHALRSQLAIQYEYVTVEDVIERPHRYDVVLNMEVVEHVADLPLFVSLCTRLVARDGILFVATINRNLLSWLFAIVGAEYILRWLPRGTHRWHKFVKPRELEVLLDRNAMTINASTGVQVNPFTRHFTLSPRHAVNYMLSAIHRDT